jgi:site-specific DNA recombinase
MSETRAFIYVRVSSNKQEDDGTSLDTQEESCRLFCTQQGWSVIGIERDTHTGWEYREREGLSRLREAIRSGDVDVVVCHAVDRLSRQDTHLNILMDEAEYHGAGYEFVTEKFEDTPVGRMVLAARAFAASVEREKIIERTMRGRKAAAKAGKVPHGQRPLYGYQWDETKTRYVVNPATAPIVRRIFQMATDGTPTRRIARMLTDEGIPTPTGKSTWKMTSINKILKHPYYGGRPAAWRTRVEKAPRNGKKIQVHHQRPEEEHIPLSLDAVPPLVPTEQWEKVQEQLKQNKLRAARNNRNPEATLLRGGHVRCGYCGRTMHVGKNNGKPAYRCPGDEWRSGTCKMPSIAAHVLDDAVWKHMKWMLHHPELTLQRIQELIGDDPTEQDLRPIERALASIDKKQTGLVRQITLLAAEIDDRDVAAPLRAELRSLVEQKRLLEKERDSLLERRQQWEATYHSCDEFARMMERVGHEERTLDYTGKRQRLEMLGVRIKVYRTDDPDHDRFTVETNLDLDWWVETQKDAWRHEDEWRSRMETGEIVNQSTAHCSPH